MTLRDLLEMLNSKEWTTAKIAKEKLPFGEKKFKDLLKELEFEYVNVGNKHWKYNGEEYFLDDDILNFIGEIKTTKPKAKAIKSESERKNKSSKEEMNNRTIEQMNIYSNELTNEKTNVQKFEGNNEQKKIIRKRSSFDIDVNLLKALKIKAIQEEKNVYELVEIAIKNLLEKRTK